MARKVLPQVPSDALAEISAELLFTKHALQRQGARRISERAVLAALYYGRAIPARRGVIYAIGKREVALQVRQGVDLSPFEGIHVVCARDGAVVTVYRNRDLRNRRPPRRPRCL